MLLVSRPLFAASALALLLLPDCKQISSVGDVLRVARVEVAPPSATLTPQETLQLAATPKTDGGLPLPNREVTWQSSAPAIVSVSIDGLVRALAVGGPVAITATVEGVQGIAAISVQPLATRLVFAQQPGSAIAGQPMTPVIRVVIQDNLLGTVTGATNPVTIALAGNPGGATLSGTQTVSAVNGIATFGDLRLDRIGNGYTFIAASSGLISITSAAFNVVPGTPNQLAFATAPPAAARSGVSLSPQPMLQLRDGSGNPVALAGVVITASIVSGPGGGAIAGTGTAQTNSTGAAIFSDLAMTGPVGSYTVAFSAPGIPPVTSAPIALSAGLPAQLTIETQPSAAQSGVPLSPQPRVQVGDAWGNAVELAGVAVTASIGTGPPGGALGGTLVVTSGGTGLAGYTNLSLSGPAGNYTLRFSGSGLTGVGSQTIVLGAGGGATLSITTQPSTTVASGAVFASQPVIQLRDAASNPVAQAGVLVTASIQTGGGTLGGTATVATNASGAASFTNLSISGVVGNRTLLFAAPGYVSVLSNSITVTAGSASQLSISTQPSSSALSGVPFPQQPVILVRDTWNNPVGGVVVTAAIASGGGTLGGAVTATSGSDGLASFTNLSITGSAGSRTLSFSAPGLPAVTSTAITVTIPPSQLIITTQPSSLAQSGVAFAQQPVVAVKDAANNPVSGIVVTAAIASGGGTLGGTLTATSAASGAATFTNLSISGTVGTRTLSFSTAGVPSVISNIINLTAGPASQLSISSQPSTSVSSGVVFSQQPIVQVKDAANNPVSGVVVTAVIATGGGTLGGTLTATSAASGAASFTNLLITGTAGNRTLSFSAPSLPSVSSNPIAVAASAASLSITTQPSATVLSGVGFPTQPVILVKDFANNPVGGIVVTAAIASGGGSLGGTPTATSNASGVATFTNLSISGTIGNRKLSFSSAPAPAVTSNDITVNPGPASQLTITKQPSASATANTNFPDQPAIQLRDAAGNAVNQSGIAVTASIDTGIGGGTLGGTVTVTTNGSGVATYSNLKISQAGTYTLRFSATGLTPVISILITVI